MLREIGSFAVLAISLTAVTARADDHESATPGAATQRPDLISMVSEEHSAKLKGKAKKALKFVRALGRYLDHRVTQINGEARQRLDPVPPRPEKGAE